MSPRPAKDPRFSAKNRKLRDVRGLGRSADLSLNVVTMRASPLMLALYQPDMAPNAGAMFRTCACLGADASIIEPCGFVFSDRRFRRSGMDYLDALRIDRHSSFAAFETWRREENRRFVLLTTKADEDLWDFSFRRGDILMVGRESAGVPEEVAAAADARVRIAIRPPLRSLNVAVAAAIAMAEAQRQLRSIIATTHASGA